MQDCLRAPISDASSEGRRCSARRSLSQTHPPRVTEHTRIVRLTEERDETLQPDDTMSRHSYRIGREHHPRACREYRKRTHSSSSTPGRRSTRYGLSPRDQRATESPRRRPSQHPSSGDSHEPAARSTQHTSRVRTRRTSEADQSNETRKSPGDVLECVTPISAVATRLPPMTSLRTSIRRPEARMTVKNAAAMRRHSFPDAPDLYV